MPKLFYCLRQQTIKDFEWLVVDDGSTDSTSDGMELILAGQKDFPVRYYKKLNGGKHTAINMGVRLAKGELFLILDSDDSLPANALETIERHYRGIKDDNAFAGVCGLMAHHDGRLIGSGLPQDILDVDELRLRFCYHVTGDLMEVFRTSVLREFPFPEIEGEKFCPEQLVWFRIAQKYKLRCFNQIVYLRDYLNDGLTAKIVKIRMDSPIATCMTYLEMLNFDIPFVQKIKAAINYYRFKYCQSKAFASKGISFHIPIQYLFVSPIGFIYHLRDSKMAK